MRDREGPQAGWARHVQAGALVATVIVSVILLGLVSSQAGRLAALERDIERDIRSVRDEIGRVDLSRTTPPGRARAEAGLAELRGSVRRIEAATGRLDGKLAALELGLPGEGLAQSIADLTKIVRELSDDLAEVRGLAEKKPARAPAPIAAAPPAVTMEDVAALDGRLARLEKLFKEGSGGPSKVRINEEALRALVKKCVDEEIEGSLRRMRERFRPPRTR